MKCKSVDTYPCLLSIHSCTRRPDSAIVHSEIRGIGTSTKHKVNTKQTKTTLTLRKTGMKRSIHMRWKALYSIFKYIMLKQYPLPT